MSSVLDGFVGVEMGGRLERSIDMVDDREERVLEGREAGGEAVSWDMIEMGCEEVP